MYNIIRQFYTSKFKLKVKYIVTTEYRYWKHDILILSMIFSKDTVYTDLRLYSSSIHIYTHETGSP